MEDHLRRRKILVIDDDPALLHLLTEMLTRAEVQVITADGGIEGLRQFYAQQPDLVILDLMMPGMDGLEVCRRIRQLSDVPVVILTALDQQSMLTRALTECADDYITKPFALDILFARLRAILRRGARAPHPVHRRVLDDGRVVIDAEDHRVWVDGEVVSLTPTEWEMLSYLAENEGRLLTYDQILDRVWGPECVESRSYVHVYANRLRNKLERNPREPRILLVEPGVGYRLEM